MYVFSISNVMQCYYMSGQCTCRQMDWMKVEPDVEDNDCEVYRIKERASGWIP